MSSRGTPPTGNRLPGGKLKYVRFALLLTVWLLILVGLVVWGANAHRGSSGQGIAGGRAPSGQAGQASAPPGPCPTKNPDRVAGVRPSVIAALKPRTAARSGVPFGRDLGRATREVEYEVTQNSATLAKAKYLAIEVTQFLTSNGDRQLPEGAVMGYAQVLGGGNRVKLHVCFDRSSQAMGEPGIYVGTVNIVDPRVARVDVPFNVSLSYPIWQYALAIYVAMLLPATLYVWLLLGSFTSVDLSFEKFQTWFYSRNAIIALGTGFAVSIGLLLGTYFKAEAWGTSITEASALK